MNAPDLFLDSPGASVSLDWPKDYEQQFWREYPLKIAKDAAMRALHKVRKKGVAWEAIIDGIQRYKTWLQEPGWRPDAAQPATWLNAGRWNDELPTGGNGNATPSQRARQFAQRAAGIEREREGGSGTPTTISIARHSG